MKNKIYYLKTFMLTLLLSTIGYWSPVAAQAPQAIPYQAVARTAAGVLITNQSISLRISIHDGSAAGTIVYRETQSKTTNALGLFSLNIGEGTVVTGTFAGINWGSGSKFTQVEMDATGGSSYTDMGTTQLMSVPYALYAVTSGTGGSSLANGTNIGNTLRWNGTAWVNDSTIYNNGGNIGIGTTVPTDRLTVLNGGLSFNQTTVFGELPVVGMDYDLTTDAMRFRANSTSFSLDTSWMVINRATGNVGIGVVSPGYKLDVGGRMRIKDGSGSAGVWFGNSTGTADVGFIGAKDDNTMGFFGNGTAGWGITLNKNNSAVSLGNGNNVSSGQSSIAIGEIINSTGTNSVAMGNLSVASGVNSVAIGTRALALGNNSLCIANTNSNYTAVASGAYSKVIGSFNATASGAHSMAFGCDVATTFQDGAFVMGDFSGSGIALQAISANSFSSRFAGGYRLFSNAALTTGVSLAAGGGSWTSISDRNKKENFNAINTEEILQKVGALPLSKWNYKSQDVSVHHIGCMAQDFYAAFHLDGESDTTINTLDIDGINMAAIQALKTRTDELKKAVDKIESLSADINELKKQVAALGKNELAPSGVVSAEMKKK